MSNGMLSSPQAALGFEDFFLDDGFGAGHLPSSPLQSSFPAYHQSSPFYDGIHKTPAARRVRTRTNDGYLVSPMVTRVPHSSSSSTLHGSSGITQTPTQCFHSRGTMDGTPVHFVDPDLAPNWGDHKTFEQCFVESCNPSPKQATSITANSSACQNEHSITGKHGYLGIPNTDVNTRDRMASTDSHMSTMTTSTSYESVMSPSMVTYHQGHSMAPSMSLPQLTGSQQPSPNLSASRSPILTPSQAGHGFYTSPEVEQGGFPAQLVQEDIDYLALAMANSVPGSVSMSAVASYPYDQSAQMTHSMSLPIQPSMLSQSTFEPVMYPAVPHMTQYPGPPMSGTTRPMDLNAWHAHTYQLSQASIQFNYTSVQPVPITAQRHASANIHGWNPPVPVMPSVIRSVSAPFIPSAASMAKMPAALATGGLFGPANPAGSSGMARITEVTGFEGCPNLPPYNKRGLEDPSPDTPRKRQTFPRIGVPLKPGPRARKTPRKGAKTKSSPDPHSGMLDPLLLDSASGSPFPLNPASGEDSSPFGLMKSDLVFGGNLNNFKPNVVQGVHGVYAVGKGIPLIPSVPGGQPKLVFQPPRTASVPGSTPTGLPKEFLEQLYLPRHTLEGSTNGLPVRRFHCLIEACGRSFPRKSAITSHLQTHLEDKPYVCNAEDCESAFVRQHDLRRHKRIHDGLKPYMCLCDKEFARGDALMRHRQRGICIGRVGESEEEEA